MLDMSFSVRDIEGLANYSKDSRQVSGYLGPNLEVPAKEHPLEREVLCFAISLSKNFGRAQALPNKKAW